MARKHNVDFSVNRSKVFSVPQVVGLARTKSGALRVGKNQIGPANDAAQEMGCGRPFGDDGKPEFTRPEKKKYMQEINHRRLDQGEARFVNFDGGYGDET